MGVYEFEPSCGHAGNFINTYIEYASKCTDASYDYHECLAYFLLACATNRIKYEAATFPYGLSTNLYMLLMGVSSLTRKSTAMDIGMAMLDRAVPGCRLSDQFSQESVVEQMSDREEEDNIQPSVIFSDEFSSIIQGMFHKKYLSGFRGFLLSIYKGAPYVYERTKKNRSKDRIEINHPHLCLIGGATPVIYCDLSIRDIADGLFPRFIICNPKSKPMWRGVHEIPELDRKLRNELTMWLSRLHQWNHSKGIEIFFSNTAHEVIGEFQQEITKKVINGPAAWGVISRLEQHAYKLAMLVALATDGIHMLGEQCSVNVSFVDAESAVRMCKKIMKWGISFSKEVVHSETDTMEDQITTISTVCMEWMKKFPVYNFIPRYIVADALKVTRRRLDDIEATLMDRGIIKVESVSMGAKEDPKKVWRPIGERLNDVRQSVIDMKLEEVESHAAGLLFAEKDNQNEQEPGDV